MPDTPVRSTLRRPLLWLGLLVIAALVLLLSAFTLLARGTFTSTRLTTTLPNGWVAIGVRAPDSAGGVATMLPIGGASGPREPVRSAAIDAALAINDSNGLSQAVADTTHRTLAGAIILDRLALAALVDVVGGIRVPVIAAFRVARVDGSVDVIAPGLRRLDGIAAANYVLADPTGNSLRRTVTALLPGLPRNHDELVGVVRSLGMSMRATASEATVVQWVEDWQGRL